MTETTANTAAPGEGTAPADEMEGVLQRVREAVASTREVIQATQELLGPAHDAAPTGDLAADG